MAEKQSNIEKIRPQPINDHMSSQITMHSHKPTKG